MSQPTKKLFVLSTGQGCLTNLLETTNVRKSLLNDPSGDFENTDHVDQADVIVVNTCGYNETAESASLGKIEELKKRFPNKKIVVGGCLTKINLPKLQEVHAGDVVGSGEWDKLPALLTSDQTNLISTNFTKMDSSASQANPIEPRDLQTRLKTNRAGERAAAFFFGTERILKRQFQPTHNILNSVAFDPKTFVVSVGTGCLGHCTYCAIKNAKGRLVSRTLEAIVADFKRGLELGYRRFHLVGDDIGCWGQDIGSDSAVLLREILRLSERFEVVINYFDPTWLVRYFDQLLEPMSDPRIICVNFPLQSGSTQLVRKMARHYDVEVALAQIAKIKAANPTLVAKTHLMVGFPGETKADFKQTLKVIRNFDLIFPNRFSPRYGTPAVRAQNQIPEQTKSYRFLKLRAAIAFRHTQVLLRSLLTSSEATHL